jgi:hypothetical protein
MTWDIWKEFRLNEEKMANLGKIKEEPMEEKSEDDLENLQEDFTTSMNDLAKLFLSPVESESEQENEYDFDVEYEAPVEPEIQVVEPECACEENPYKDVDFSTIDQAPVHVVVMTFLVDGKEQPVKVSEPVLKFEAEQILKKISNQSLEESNISRPANSTIVGIKIMESKHFDLIHSPKVDVSEKIIVKEQKNIAERPANVYDAYNMLKNRRTL